VRSCRRLLVSSPLPVLQHSSVLCLIPFCVKDGRVHHCSVALACAAPLLPGYFPMLIATVEAFRTIGYDRTKASLIELYKSYRIAREASEKDDTLDENNDGVADVNQISKSQLISRKIRVVLTAVDPSMVNEALAGVSSGLMAVLATLKLQFAQTAVLASAIGDVFSKAFDKVLHEPLLVVVPSTYHKWIPVGLKWLSRTLAMSAAYTAQRVISAFHSALRGAQVVARAVARLRQACRPCVCRCLLPLLLLV
jgi:hypothetical protein